MSDNINPELTALYRKTFGVDPVEVIALRADGSDRRIYRLVGSGQPATVIGISGVDLEENRAFISYSRALRSAGLPVPQIHGVGEGDAIYLEEDLGDVTLFNALVEGRRREGNDQVPLDVVALYRRVIELLPRLQVEGGKVIDYSLAHPHAEFDRQSMMWDLNYFKYHFLKLAGIAFNEARLERDFINLCDFLLQADRSHFLYRDFQSRNIMIRDGEPWFIDYQGGRRGALQYDIASLLYDAKADLNNDLRTGLLEFYLDSLETHIAVDRAEFVRHYQGFVLIRIMQAMGAYGYRGYFQRKNHFLDSVPFAVRNIESIIMKGAIPIELPELVAAFVEIVRRMGDGESGRGGEGVRGREEPSLIPTLLTPVPEVVVSIEPEGRESCKAAIPADQATVIEAKVPTGTHVVVETDAPADSPVAVDVAPTSGSDAGVLPVVSAPPVAVAVAMQPAAKKLTVRITSFSYRRGYPEERSENGGGFVFDCRALHNPGRYDEYRDLCGCDAPVIEFLEREEPVIHFWHAVVTLVDIAVENYIARGFTDLSISFGCTGGQHRSVYFSERLSRHLAERYPQVVVELGHREQSRWPSPTRTFEARFPTP
jgi:aminoglycoside/choline kinase family phosphotransferase